MKANRKFVDDADAVSPVIAVILMVAITVVLAATVFVLVSDIGGQQNVAPAFNLSKDEGADQLKVESSADNANWNRLELRTSVDATWALNWPAEGNETTAPAWDPVSSATNPMSAGEYLEFCGTGLDVVIDIRDVQANQNMGSWTFQTLAACA
jgi:flagellin-like protein